MTDAPVLTVHPDDLTAAGLPLADAKHQAAILGVSLTISEHVPRGTMALHPTQEPTP